MCLASISVVCRATTESLDEIHIGGFTSERQQDTGFISFLVDLRNKI
jgi:hypothetical protein